MILKPAIPSASPNCKRLKSAPFTQHRQTSFSHPSTNVFSVSSYSALRVCLMFYAFRRTVFSSFFRFSVFLPIPQTTARSIYGFSSLNFSVFLSFLLFCCCIPFISFSLFYVVSLFCARLYDASIKSYRVFLLCGALAGAKETVGVWDGLRATCRNGMRNSLSISKVECRSIWIGDWAEGLNRYFIHSRSFSNNSLDL